MSEKSVLVTGGAGYIGSHTALALIDAGWDVVIIDTLVTGRRELVPAEARFVHGDAGDIENVMRLLLEMQCRYVLHFAGSIVVPESVVDPLKYYRNNTGVSRNLLAACVQAGVEGFIFSSTAAVYGNPDVLPVTEDAPLMPLAPYGTSKLMTEMMLRDVAATGSLRYVALRYFNVAGADPQGRTGQATPDATHLIKVACETACGKRDALTIFGDDYNTPDGTCVRDYIHVSDLAAAHVAALDYLVAGGKSEVINCGYGTGYSVRQVIDTLEGIAGQKLKAVIGPRRPGDAESIYAASERIRQILSWTPQHDDLETIVSTALAWERRQHNS